MQTRQNQSTTTSPQSTHVLNSPPPQSALDQSFLAARAALDKKAENLVMLDLSRVSSFTDYFILCSVHSDRQAKAVCDSVTQTLREVAGLRALTVEGYAEGRWILIDFGSFVMHVFLDALRDYYRLETLWGDAPKVTIPSEVYGH